MKPLAERSIGGDTGNTWLVMGISLNVGFETQ